MMPCSRLVRSVLSTAWTLPKVWRWIGRSPTVASAVETVGAGRALAARPAAAFVPAAPLPLAAATAPVTTCSDVVAPDETGGETAAKNDGSKPLQTHRHRLREGKRGSCCGLARPASCSSCDLVRSGRNARHVFVCGLPDCCRMFRAAAKASDATAGRLLPGRSRLAQVLEKAEVLFTLARKSPLPCRSCRRRSRASYKK